MLVLSRKKNEQILIGDDICLTVLKVTDRRVTIGISAPDAVSIRRAELHPVEWRERKPMPRLARTQVVEAS